MKKTKIFSPRPGIRFPRDRTTGPVAGLVKGDIETVVVPMMDGMGSVNASAHVQSSGSDSLDASILGLGVGGLGYDSSIVQPQLTDVPSWTNRHLGRNSAFVITALSSSDHEVKILNAYRSGSEDIGGDVVTVDSDLYYSKRTLKKVTVKKTASFFDTVFDSGDIHEFIPIQFTASMGTLLNDVSGTVYNTDFAASRQSSTETPAHIYIDVPVSGKIVDISVWVELHHASASAAVPPNLALPLGMLGMAIKSPNVACGWGHPVAGAMGLSDANTDQFYANSFLLWEGTVWSPFATAFSHGVTWGSEGTDPVLLANFREHYCSWERDFSMRTVFNDGARVRNPRHVLGPISGNYHGSPNAALGLNSAWGAGVYWTGSVGSPPVGWLSGPGGTASANEWPTTGSNRGADYLKPIYPMLDTIEVSLAPESPGIQYEDFYFSVPLRSQVSKIRGIRKGLRGTEMKGRWKILFACDAAGSTTSYHRLYFRQVRLEITYEENEGVSLRRSSSRVSPNRAGPRSLVEISGTAPVTASNFIRVIDPEYAEVGRSFGIQLLTGSVNFSAAALTYRLTGTLADTSGSAPGWLLNNMFGMPMIPQNSSSLVDNQPQPIQTINPNDILATRPLVDPAYRLKDAATDAKKPKIRLRTFADILSGTLT